MSVTARKSIDSLSLFALAWPIAIETLLQFLMGTVDSLMVSRLGDDAVSAVGLSNQVLQSIMTIFVLINGGAGIVIARHWGAGSLDTARRASAMALKAGMIGGALLSLLFAFGSGGIIRLMQTPSEVAPDAITYMTIIGSCVIITELNMMMTSMIRSTGNTRAPMLIAVGMNAVHLILNYGFIFGELGLPRLGIVGIGISTIVSRLLALLVSAWVLSGAFEQRFQRSDWRGFDRPILKEMMAIGLPNLGTAASWGYSQIVQLSIVSSLGAVSLAAYTYTNVIQQLPWLIGSALGVAAQIQCSQLYGGKRYDAAYRSPYRAAAAGIPLALGLAALVYSFGEEALGWFTSDADVIAKALPLLLLCLIWQPMRTWTYAITNTLNAVGEAKFVALNTVIGMWIFATGGAYVFGVLAGWGIVGVLTGLMIDEVYRAVLVGWRWSKRRKLPKEQAVVTTNLANGGIMG
ncbi:MATE family efflux transporter [Paenibacillus sp. CCS19]|uniref:MATE family efflux transporter n=1 Tax=Paenibacillus sp. CCS19 TaxID=3158387 RepID=UPI0025649024|nr:MATE family efflux transporter [Paenibacillus cellulosilyticus]GMK40983.1 MATE family efflux transporter [Paenibacillus cellulosilyticus]